MNLRQSKIALLLGFVFIIQSCSKKSLQAEVPKPSNSEISRDYLLVKAQQWYNKLSSKAKSQKASILNSPLNISNEINWETTKYFYQLNFSVSEVSRSKTSNKQKSYLAIQYDDNGGVLVGFYIDLLSNNPYDLTPSFFTPNFISGVSVPTNFKGVVIVYDISGNIIDSKNYSKSLLNNSNKKDIIRVKLSTSTNNNGNPNGTNAPPPEGCSYQTVDWYWQTYDEAGNLLYEEYLYSTEEMICLGDGGGGSSGGTGSMTGQDWLNYLLSCGQVKSDKKPIALICETPISKTERFPWLCYYTFSGLQPFSHQWFFTSEELGTKHLGIDNKWHWESMTHSVIHKTGYGLGSSYNLTNVSAVPAIYVTPFGELASMSLTFDINISLIFENVNFDISSSKSAACAWFVQTNGIPATAM